MSIDKKVEICIIALVVLFIVLFFGLVSLIAFLSFMIVHCWWRYLGIKTVLIFVTIITIFYFLVRAYKRLVRYVRAERLRRFRIFWRFYLELRNEAYIRGTRRRKEQAERARQIRRQDDREFKQRMTRLLEGGKALGEKREQCVREYKQTLKTKEQSQKKLEKENRNTTNSKYDYTPKSLLPLLEERKDKMEKIIQRRKEDRETKSTVKKESNQSGIISSHEVDTTNLSSLRAAFSSFIEGVKRMDQTCRSSKGPKMYYMLYNVDYAIINVLSAMKELLNTNGVSWESLSIGLRSSREIPGLCKSATNLSQDMRAEQQDKPSSSTDIQSLEEEIDHLMSTAHSRVLFVRDRALKSIDDLIEREQNNTLATRLALLDDQQIRSCFQQDDITEVFSNLRDVILPKFRKCITTKMENDKMNATNMDRWERRFDESMAKAQKRQSLTHLKAWNGHARTIVNKNPLKEKDSLDRTQGLWSYSEMTEKRKKRQRWLESLRRSNKDNSVTYLAVGSAAVIAVTSYAVYRYLR